MIKKQVSTIINSQPIATEWISRTVKFPTPSNHQTMTNRWQQWNIAIQNCDDEQIHIFGSLAAERPVVKACLDAIFSNSHYLSYNLISNPWLGYKIFTDGPTKVVEESIKQVCRLDLIENETRSELMARLRTAKITVATAVAIADIGLNLPVLQITAWLSNFAEASLQISCCHLLRELHNRGKIKLTKPEKPTMQSGLIVLGMGKLGAKELNYSSDVDIIILFQDTTTCISAGTHQQIFSQLARNLVTLMAKRTADGYVFRTDLRLRPDPGSTPPAISVNRAMRYYRNLAQTWERAAMIKARPIAGDLDAGKQFLQNNARFVWRRNLDFPALQDIQAIKRKINAHKKSGDIAVEGHNIKLGRGGIREIEFLTQTKQLIWGGQNLTLRGRGTIEMLGQLANAGRMSINAATELQKSYLFLRRIEHRIQMVDDLQTHSLPESAKGVEQIANFLGFKNADRFRNKLLKNLRIVESYYNGMFENTSTSKQEIDLDFIDPGQKANTIEKLTALGFTNCHVVYDKIFNWLAGKILATQKKRPRTILQGIAVPLVLAFASTANPTRTFERFDGLLGRLPRSINLLSSIAVEPTILRLVAEIMGAAPLLTDWISQRPSLLEGVLQTDFQKLDPSLDIELEPEISEIARRGLVRIFYEREFRPKEMRKDLAKQISIEGGKYPDLQLILDAQRRWVQNKKFQIGIHIFRGDLTPSQASLPLGDIAEVCLESLMEYINIEFAKVHGKIDDGQLAILAFGRLGSQEMTLSSDIDLIFVYSHAPNAKESNGDKGLVSTQYYAKLCRRFVNGITAPTAEGKLYEVDMRLRPSGKSGPIACSIERFEAYQKNDAWTWEHQALTRARVIYAEGDLGRRLNSIIRSILSKPRDRKKLAHDIRSMRARIRRELENPTKPTIKLRRGGILDAEFIAQFIQLLFASKHPTILQRDACSVFLEAGELELIDPAIASELHRDLLFWRDMEGIMQLSVENDKIENNAVAVMQKTFGLKGSNLVKSTFLDAMKETSDRIERQFDATIR